MLEKGRGDTPERVFAQRMKRERNRRHLRQEDLASLLREQGIDIHQSAIAKIERDPDPDKGFEPRMIRLDEAAAIAATFQLGIDEMLSDNDLTDEAVELARLREAYEQAQHEAAAAVTRAHMATEEAHRREEELRNARAMLDQLSRVRAAKGQAIAEQDYDMAAKLREEELRLTAIQRFASLPTLPT